MQPLTFGKLPKGRKTVVDLLTMISSVSPPAYMISQIDMTAANKIKNDLAAVGKRITLTAILIKAIAIAQAVHPASRSQIFPFGKVITYENIVAGFTIEREEDGHDTVFFGEVEAPQSKSLVDIARELSDHAQSAICELPALALQKSYVKFPYLLRKFFISMGNGFPALRLKCQRATFGITTLGKYKISHLFSPCICTSTFGIGSVENKAVVRDGAIVIRSAMDISFNYNMRVINEFEAAAFLQDVCRIMEGKLPGLEIVSESTAIHGPDAFDESTTARGPEAIDESMTLESALQCSANSVA